MVETGGAATQSPLQPQTALITVTVSLTSVHMRYYISHMRHIKSQMRYHISHMSHYIIHMRYPGHEISESVSESVSGQLGLHSISCQRLGEASHQTLLHASSA